MKIGIIARDLTKQQGGGAYNIINILSRELPRQDSNNSYVIFTNGPVKDREHIVQLPNLPRIIWDHILIPLYAYRHHVDLLICPKNVVPLFWFRKSLAIVLDLAYYDIPEAYNSLEARYMRYGIHLSARKATKLAPISRYTAKRLKELFSDIDPSRIEVVYIASETVKPSNEELLPEKLTNQIDIRHKEYVLFVGGIQPRKNLRTLILAMEQIWKTGSNLHLVVVGKKSVKWEESFTGIDPQTLQKVFFTGYIDRADLETLYANALVYVNPSLYEGFGITVLEAFSLGCPVIASNVTSLPEVVGDAGILFDPNNVKSLANAIQNIQKDDTLRDKLITFGRKQLQKFSWEKTLKKYISVINSI